MSDRATIDAQLDRLLATTLRNIEKLTVTAEDNEVALGHLFRVAAYAHYSVVHCPSLISRSLTDEIAELHRRDIQGLS